MFYITRCHPAERETTWASAAMGQRFLMHTHNSSEISTQPLGLTLYSLCEGCMNKSADIRNLARKEQFLPMAVVLTLSVFFTLSADRRSEVGIISWEKSWAGANIWRWPHVASGRQLVRLSVVFLSASLLSCSFSVFFWARLWSLSDAL